MTENSIGIASFSPFSASPSPHARRSTRSDSTLARTARASAIHNSYYALPFRFGFLFPNFKGVGFWNLGTAPRDVNEIDYVGRTFSALYFAGDKILTSRQWEAIFEGREDYEYLRMLKNIKGEAAEALRKTIAAELEKELDGDEKAISLWDTPKDRSRADSQTSRIWDLLSNP